MHLMVSLHQHNTNSKLSHFSTLSLSPNLQIYKIDLNDKYSLYKYSLIQQILDSTFKVFQR